MVSIIGLDPGNPTSFVAMQDGNVTGFGRITVDFSASAADAFLHAPLECEYHDDSLPARLCDMHDPLVIIERQRGYLRWHLSDPLLHHLEVMRCRTRVVPPSEKFRRLGITANKEETVACATRHARSLSNPLFQFLNENPVERTHDIADSLLLIVMVLEDSRSIPSKEVCLWQPSGCLLARALSSIYFDTKASSRLGATVPRRLEIRSRIASCIVSPAAASLCGPLCDQVIPLTRRNLRALGACASEASDLCLFFKAVNDLVGGISVRVMDLSLSFGSNGRTLCLKVAERDLFVDVFVRKVVRRGVVEEF